MKQKLIALAVTLGLAGTGTAVADHSFAAEFDGKKPIRIEGTLSKLEWTNPHSQIHLDISDDKGNVVQWNFETQPPNILAHAGWTKNSLKPGDQVTIVGNPAKNGAPVGIIQKVILANGQELMPNPR